MEKISFEILGQKMDIAIREDDQKDVIQILKYYKKKTKDLEKLHPHRTSLEIAILAGIKVTEEYYSCYRELTGSTVEKSDTVNKMLDELGKQLDSVMKL